MRWLKIISFLLLIAPYRMIVLGQNAPEVVRYSEKYLMGYNPTPTSLWEGTQEDRRIEMEVTYDSDKGIIFFHNRQGKCSSYCLRFPIYTLSDGRKIEYGRRNDMRLELDDYKGEKLTVSSFTFEVPFGFGKSGYLEFKAHTFQVNKEILSFKAWKADWEYKKALKGGLTEEINYLKKCPYIDHRRALENDIVNNKTKNIKDIVYVNENYPVLTNRLAEKMLPLISSVSDCRTFLKYYDGYAFKAEEILYNLLKETTSQTDIDAYIEIFPSGKHITEMKALKTELQYWTKATNGGITECATYISKYPNGRFVSEIKSRKSRLEQLQANSNKSTWKMGNKICYCNTSGITMVTLDQWNEDKSNFKGIVIASPGGLYEGNILQKGNLLWIEPKNWHKCLEDEVEYALNNDRSNEAERLLKEKNKKFDRGTIVSQSFSSRGLLFSSTHTVTAKVEDWNEDFTKMKIQIVKTGGLDRFDGEDIYEGKYIWVSPIGWR